MVQWQWGQNLCFLHEPRLVFELVRFSVTLPRFLVEALASPLLALPRPSLVALHTTFLLEGGNKLFLPP